MSSDKILQQFSFQNGVDQFSDTSPATYPVGNPRRLFFSNTHNGVSGYPLDSFLDAGTLPTILGEWTLEQAHFNASATNDMILDYTSDVPGNFLSMYMSPDGIYFFGEYASTIYRFTLSTPFEIGSATIDVGQIFSTGNSINGICFNPSGTEMYFTDGNTDTIEQYTLSIAYDLTSAVYTGSSSSIPDDAFISIKITDDGVYFFLFSFISPYSMVRYTLSTPFDITTAGSVVSENLPNNKSTCISSDGTSIIRSIRPKDNLTITGYILEQYTLTTAYDLTTLTEDNIAFPIEVFNREYETVKAIGVYFYIEPNGKYAYITATFPNVGVTEYLVLGINLTNDCVNCWDILNLTYNSITKNVSTEDTNPNSISYTQDGINAYVVGSQTGKIHHYQASTPYEANTLSYNTSKDISTDDTTPVDIFVMYYTSSSNYRRRVYVLGASTNTLYHYDTNPDDFSNFLLSQSYSVASQTTSPTAFFFSSSGTKLWVLDSSGVIYQYSISLLNPFSLNYITYDSVSYIVTQDNDCRGLYFDRSLFKMYVTGNQNKKIYEFDLSIRGDISTASFVQDYSVSSQVDQVAGLFISPLGDSFQVVSNGAIDAVFQYDIS